eukprot:2284119-Amphidinium_carterae.1
MEIATCRLVCLCLREIGVVWRALHKWTRNRHSKKELLRTWHVRSVCASGRVESRVLHVASRCQAACGRPNSSGESHYRRLPTFSASTSAAAALGSMHKPSQHTNKYGERIALRPSRNQHANNTVCSAWIEELVQWHFPSAGCTCVSTLPTTRMSHSSQRVALIALVSGTGIMRPPRKQLYVSSCGTQGCHS